MANARMQLPPISAPWAVRAFEEMVRGILEIPGSDHNPRILEYHDQTSLRAGTDEVPWCASFVNWCLREAGIAGSRSASARSFVDWGYQCGARLGGIVVLSRGRPPAGHVGFLVGEVQGGGLLVLGGNQGDTVSIAAFQPSRLLGYRWPVSEPWPVRSA